jgi:integrase
MLFRLVRPVRRSDSSKEQFLQRIPKDLLARAARLSLSIPLDSNTTVHLTISPKAEAVRFSLRTRDPSETKTRHARATAYLETVWRALRQDAPIPLTNRQATALAGQLYRAWALGEGGERTTSVTIDRLSRERRPDYESADHGNPDSTPDIWEKAAGFLDTVEEADAKFHEEAESQEAQSDPNPARPLEKTFGPLIDRLLLAEGIRRVDPASREMLLRAFRLALKDAFEARRRNASGDYSSDPKAERFPEFEAKASPPPPQHKAPPTLTGLLKDWQREAQRKPSTFESYRNTMASLVGFLGHDDASRVTPADILRFKDHRLATINPRTGRPISAKTVKDSDLAGLRTIFGWAVANLRLPSNPALGLTIKLSKPAKLRSKGFTDEEATAILSAASRLQRGPGERSQTLAAKRWVPWLCAYTGARVGEMAQLRKQDVTCVGKHWVIRVTPEAGTVKTNEARTIVLHPHLIEQGFPAFVQSAPPGHLFLNAPPGDGDIRGVWQATKNRLAEFARSIVTDPNVAPNHGWRHRFKTVGMEAGIAPRILDAIQGQAARSVADTYGDVTVSTMAREIGKLPRIVINQRP